MEKTGRVQAIDRAVQILQCFSEKKPELKLKEIADMLGLNKSTVHGIITTLKYHGLIDQEEESQKYRLGLSLMKYGDLVSKSMDVVSIARPYITQLCDTLEETVHLGHLDGFDVVYIDKIESTQSMRISTARGTRNPAYCTGVGKAMLAHQPVSAIKSWLKGNPLRAVTEKTITNEKVFLKELQQIRRDGYAFDDEENAIGLTCVAAPVFDHLGKAIYAISLSGPTARMTKDKIGRATEAVRQAAEDISERLGHTRE